MQSLGVEVLIVTNAAGGLHPQYACGDIVVIDDQINLMFRNPLIGVHDDVVGTPFPDMSAPYDRRLASSAVNVARRNGVGVHRGVYIGVLGPNYETRAEYRMLRRLGGDVVGMSTVPEVIAAVQVGLRVLALSTVTNVCLPDQLGVTTGSEVVSTAASVAQRVRDLILGVLATL